MHARIAAQLVVGNINKGEQVAVILDHRSTKPNVSFGDTVKSMANYGMTTAAVVSAITIDSQANDLLQVADLIAGSIANHRRDPRPRTLSKKAQIAWDLAQSIGVRDFISDTHRGRLNLKTVTKMRRGQPA